MLGGGDLRRFTRSLKTPHSYVGRPSGVLPDTLHAPTD